MPHTGFGQSTSGVFQVAYVVEDIDKAIHAWVDERGVGPWFTMSGFTGADPVYRGEPSKASISVAMTFSGGMSIELIQPEDNHPSIWREHIDVHGYGFHHVGRLTTSYGADVERYRNSGQELVFQAVLPTGGRLGFIETSDVLPGYQELVELNDASDSMFTQFYAAALVWDGTDPIRPIG
ncbi:VOC family protein [Mycolicibacterium sp. YH-1]|uniref:VOC family protein n=1 Tax=Mycolicibacterium sp. YH-1 TaxID=2908837 RepID=UPI001F4BF1E3|nr:VOC family protein [Mycolicibacterium sp. YH-1]UNB54518.1 VOC family protein [Mycolicibacterium sp. YH-1]